MLQTDQYSIPYPFTLFDSLTEGVYIVDPDWRFIYANDKAAGIIGKPHEELLGKNIWELHPEAVETILGDKDRLGQVLINLITNAVKYSPQANHVDTILSSTNNAASISVRDFGVGISKADQKHIFERFFRAYDSSNKTFRGLGMGLYIAHDIVQRHGGELTVESEEGFGSTFIISLPIEKQVPA